MNTSTSSNTRGFTIIEVVLVLAIAGLIFLLVFLAVPALQRGQRDNQRRSDVGRLIAQVNAYQSNNRGQLPTAGILNTTFKTSYLTNNSTFDDPTHGPYTIANTALPGSYATAQTVADGAINWYQGALCEPANASGLKSAGGTATTSRSVAVLVKLEQGGNYCQNN